jgi:hypothetical protein
MDQAARTVSAIVMTVACTMCVPRELMAQVKVPSPARREIPPLPNAATNTVMGIRVLNVADKGTITAQMSENGVPFVTLEVEANGRLRRGDTPNAVALDANGEQVAYVCCNQRNQIPYRTELKWSPWRGNGKYALTILSQSEPGGPEVSQSLSVNVTGVPDAATPLATVLKMYRERFNLVLVKPVMTRIPPVNSHSWYSAAYVGDTLYDVEVCDTGQVFTGSRPIGRAGEYPICHPSGRHHILVVFVDYGNTGITKTVAIQALRAATTATNGRYSDYAKRHNLKVPIMQLDVQGVYISPPPTRGQLITLEQIKQLANCDPSEFDLLAQVDLDTEHHFRDAQKSTSYDGAGGIAFKGCDGDGTKQVNMWVEVLDAQRLGITVQGSLLDHELAHVFGWDHHWPTGDGSTRESQAWNRSDLNNYVLPTLLFGWQDTDGDGIPEILDSTPYGQKVTKLSPKDGKAGMAVKRN